MHPYEVTFIVRPELDEQALTAVVDKVKGFVTNGGGQVSEVNPWGRRRLAYPINKIREGQYVFIRAQLPAQMISGLERDLRLSEQILRFLVVRAEE
jgi:small subunit ribosomal protein S6